VGVMDINIKNKKENKLLNRTEVEFEVSYESSTPSRQQVIQKLAALLKVKSNLVILSELRSDFGNKKAKAKANIYVDEETMQDIEREYLIKRSHKEESKKEEAKE
jgi:small subunit ribosomal protein S24e